MRALLASPLGFLIGLSLGALGGGGSILAVPALVYAAGQTPGQATTTSLVLVAITALTGLVPHWRAGRVRVGAGAMFALTGVGGSLLGSRMNRSADPDVLLLAFSGLMLVAAFGMWRKTRRSACCPVPRSLSAAAATPLPATGGPSSRRVHAVSVRTAAKVVVGGSVVGFLTGFFGVGGGFVIVPALVLALQFPMAEAVGTSLLVIAVNSAVALATRLHGGALEWDAIVPFTVASLGGVVVGSRLAGRGDSRVLQRWFVALLVGVALYTALRSGIRVA